MGRVHKIFISNRWVAWGYLGGRKAFVGFCHRFSINKDILLRIQGLLYYK